MLPCVSWAEGKYSGDGKKCVSCEAGKYAKDAIGLTTCEPCIAGTYVMPQRCMPQRHATTLHEHTCTSAHKAKLQLRYSHLLKQ